MYKEDNRKLAVDILRIYRESKKRYGAPKIQQILEREGKHVSIKRVGKRMRFLKIKSCIVKKYTDITYIYVKNYGWTYLATVEDLCSRAIIGYSYGKTIKTCVVEQ